MSEYRFNKGVYIMPTPAGAYYSVSSEEETPTRSFLQTLLIQEETPMMTTNKLEQWHPLGKEEGMSQLYQAQVLGWVEGLDLQQHAPEGMLEDVLPGLLSELSGAGKALLSDSQGLYICSGGFPHESAEELSALSADIASLHLRHEALLKNNLGLDTSAWSLVDAAGSSQLGFWPIFVGGHRFVLVISGIPHLNRPALTQLIWSLTKRYGAH